MPEDIKQIIESKFSFCLNNNQLRDIERLIFEIKKREKLSLERIITYLKNHSKVKQCSGKDKFSALKNALIKYRFPLVALHGKIDAKKVFLTHLTKPLKNNWQVNLHFKPLKVFIEKDVVNSSFVKNFKKNSPNLETEEIIRASDYLKQNKFVISQLKKPFAFIIKERNDFLKPCPCTKGHLRCGYWIFNMGFGCPYDCSYCFLQQYSNFPGITLPANLDDFFEKFNKFSSKLKKPIRIGTGEFSDSLALDHITGYSKQLIPYFKDKPVLFELKTKSNHISNLLELKPPSNIVISWSLNPQSLIDTEEVATASLKERLAAAKTLQGYGYKIAFHFDPIIHVKGWQKLYKTVIGKLYSNFKGPFSWISLGTLRSNRRLKSISEGRFPKSEIFYGELLIGEDKKLRYPKFLRSEIYKNMLRWVKSYDNKTPVYLCMEDESIWKEFSQTYSSKQIERNLIEL